MSYRDNQDLRSIAEGGWFYAENELFTVFAPLIGADGIAVYMAMCRLIPRAAVDPRYPVTMKAIEEASMVSKSQAQRMKERIVALGMIEETKGSSKRPSTFKLRSLRELALLGADELQNRSGVPRWDTDPDAGPAASRAEERRDGAAARIKHTIGAVARVSGVESAQSNAAGPPEFGIPPWDTDQPEKTAVWDTGVPESRVPLITEDQKNLERERMRACEDVQPFVTQIVLAHPRALLRHWTTTDIPMPDRVAVTEAVKSEAARNNATPAEAAVRMLALVSAIAREVPREEWQYLKDIEKFFRLREYRIAPAHLTRGGRNGSTQHHRETNGNGLGGNPAVQRRAVTREAIRSVAARRYGAGAGDADGRGSGPVPEPGAAAVDGGDASGAVGRPGDEVRDGGVPGRVIEGRA